MFNIARYCKHHSFKSSFDFFQHVLLKIASFHSAFMEKNRSAFMHSGAEKDGCECDKVYGDSMGVSSYIFTYVQCSMVGF